MTTICFFPFTHVTQAQKETLEAFFREVRVLTLDPDTAPEPETSGLVPFGLSGERAAALELKLAEYLSWARIHKGNEKNLRHLLKKTPYFKSDTDLTSIRSQVVGGGEQKNEADNCQDETLDPGLFLKLAQTHDRENEVIEDRLSALDQGREQLLAELKGEMEDEDGPAGVHGAAARFDPGLVMPDRRMEAWAELAAEAGMFSDEAPLLVTTSPGMLAWLTDNAEEVINGLDIDSIKVHENGCGNRDNWFRDVETLLDQIMADPSSGQDDAPGKGGGCCDVPGQIQVRIFPGGELNRKYRIPGRQLTVCLVGLNS